MARVRPAVRPPACYNEAMTSTIALIAHDGKKDDMVRFALAHKEALAAYKDAT